MQNSTTPTRSSGLLRFMTAASIVLLIGCAYFAYHYYSQSEALKNSNKDLQANLNSKDSILNKIADEQNVIKNPNITVVNMQGTTVAPHSSANVYWDTASSSVYLVLKNMPKLPSDQQYQLWAIIDKTPKDLGEMNNTQKADAFAITIEKKGGSPSPTLEKMQSMGKIKQPL